MARNIEHNSVVLLGFGRWGQRIAEKIGHQNIKSVVVSNPEHYTAENLNLNFISQEDLMAFEVNNFTAIVCTPIPFLYPSTLWLLEKNSKVFCEKPLSISLHQVRQFKTKFEQTQLWVNYLYQFSDFATFPTNNISSMRFYWSKFSLNRDLVENLFTHELSLVAARLGEMKCFEKITPVILSENRLHCLFRYNYILIEIDIETSNSFTSEIKNCKTQFLSGVDHMFDFTLEKKDKLEQSLDAFYAGEQKLFIKNYKIIETVNLILDKLTIEAK
jgi:hypothetical protein